MFLIVAFAFIALAGFTNAAFLLKGANHPCAYNNATTCNSTLIRWVGGDQNTPEIVFLEGSSSIYYGKYDGTLISVGSFPNQAFDISGISAVKVGNNVFVGYVYFSRCESAWAEMYFTIKKVDLTTKTVSTLCNSNTFWGGGSFTTCSNSAAGSITADSTFIHYNAALKYQQGFPAVTHYYYDEMGVCQISSGNRTVYANRSYSGVAGQNYLVNFGYVNQSSNVVSWYGNTGTGITRRDYYTGTSVANYTLGDHSSDTRFTSFDGNIKSLFNTNRDGNWELYYGNSTNNLQNSRLTTTSANEILSSTLTAPTGNVFVSYNVSNLYYGNYFCGTDDIPVWSNVCGTAPTGIAFPDVVTTSWDESCCGWPLPNARDCHDSCVIAEDWVHTTYTIDGRIALPASHDTVFNDTTKYYQGINASCKVCCPACDEAISCYDMTFHDPAARDPDQTEWTYNVQNSAFPPGTPPQWGGQDIVVQCTSGIANTETVTPFRVENTNANYSFWSLVTGANGIWQDSVKSNERPEFQLITNVAYYNGWFADMRCTITSELLALYDQKMEIDESYGAGSQNGAFLNHYKLLFQNWVVAGATNSEIRYGTTCVGNLYGTTIQPRYAARTHLRSFTVQNNCPTLATTYINSFSWTTAFGNQTNGTFYTGQQPTMRFKWVAPDYGGQNYNQLGVCSVTILNATDSSVVVPTRLYSALDMPPEWSNDWYFFNIGFSGYDALPGNYTVNITCSDALLNNKYNGQTYCMAPASTQKNFSIVSSPCENTHDSCGFTLPCGVCSDVQCTCEDGTQQSVGLYCVEQECRSQGAFGDCFVGCKNNQLYTLSVWSDRIDYQCMNPPVKIKAQILKSKNPVDPMTIGNVAPTCKITLYWGDLIAKGGTGKGGTGVEYGMTYDPSTKTYVFDYDKQKSVTKMNWQCANNYTARVDCMSDNFTGGSKTGYTSFTLGALAYCTDGTMKSQCVSERTGSDNDNPLYCNAGLAIVNMSSICGCPNGMTVNLTSGTCDGHKSVSINILDSLSLTWILFIILLVPVALYAAKIMHIFE